MSILVESPGLLATFQDLGRNGYQHLGVGPSGAMDDVSHRIANLLVGNPQEATTLEITLSGPELLFETTAMIALCGGDLSPRIGDHLLPLWRPVMVREGSRLTFGKAEKGARCYLAVDGGFRLPRTMGSTSTHLAAKFGGFQGRPLQRGDRLTIEPAPRDHYPTLQWRFSLDGKPFLGLDWFAAWFREMDFARPSRLRFIPGSQWHLLTEASREQFLGATFRVSSNSDRMGIRLQGPRLALEHPVEMVSSGVATGTLQLPPDGSPILLMADRQTTGGYPRLGELLSVDLPKAAQLRPGEKLSFARASIEEAQDLYLRREDRFRELERTLADRRTR